MMNSFQDNEPENYVFDNVDHAVVSITRQLIAKVLRSSLLGDSQLEVVRAIERVFVNLPKAGGELDASFTITGPRRKFGDHEIYHFWTVEVGNQLIEVLACGHFYRPSTGGDSFTSFRWVASPGFATDCQDFAASLRIVDDAKPYGTEIDELDLNEPGYTISVVYDTEEVLDGNDDEEEIDDDENDEIDEDSAMSGDDVLVPELTACLWAFMDAETQMVYALGGRAYWLSGSDEVKLQLLRKLSRYDYRSARRIKVPERFCILYGSGSKQSGVAAPSAMNDPNAMLFEDVFAELEKELPPVPDFANNRPMAQAFSDDPLCVRTIVFEDAAGNCRAIVDEKDRAWLERQM